MVTWVTCDESHPSDILLVVWKEVTVMTPVPFWKVPIFSIRSDMLLKKKLDAAIFLKAFIKSSTELGMLSGVQSSVWEETRGKRLRQAGRLWRRLGADTLGIGEWGRGKLDWSGSLVSGHSAGRGNKNTGVTSNVDGETIWWGVEEKSEFLYWQQWDDWRQVPDVQVAQSHAHAEFLSHTHHSSRWTAYGGGLLLMT